MLSQTSQCPHNSTVLCLGLTSVLGPGCTEPLPVLSHTTRHTLCACTAPGHSHTVSSNAFFSVPLGLDGFYPTIKNQLEHRPFLEALPAPPPCTGLDAQLCASETFSTMPIRVLIKQNNCWFDRSLYTSSSQLGTILSIPPPQQGTEV